MNATIEGLRTYLTDIELNLIQGKKIGIAGCGGLGSNCANNLVRLGFKNFIIADFDKVEASNLNRQFYFSSQIGEMKCNALKKNLLLINTDLNITCYPVKLDKKIMYSVFNDCDYIVEAFDKVEFKKTLIELFTKKHKVISATGLGSYWKVDDIRTVKLNPNLVVIGDQKSEINSKNPPLSPGVTIAAAKQAAAILEFTIGEIKCLE